MPNFVQKEKKVQCNKFQCFSCCKKEEEKPLKSSQVEICHLQY
jgi:hypothetical protein